jgi:hypothetical protein
MGRARGRIEWLPLATALAVEENKDGCNDQGRFSVLAWQQSN